MTSIRYRLARRRSPCNFGDEFRQLGIYAKQYTGVVLPPSS